MNTSQYCSLITKELAPSIIGTAGYKPCQIFLELAQPWSSNILLSEKVPEGVDILMKDLMRKYKTPINLNAICSDQTPDRDALNLMILYCLPGSHQYTYLRYKVSFGQIVPFLRQSLTSLFTGEAPEEPSSIGEGRAMMVCCHGQRDRCCGEFGLELYRHMREFCLSRGLDIEVWKASHIGGHKYAPTLIDLPSMRVWGHLSTKEAESLLLRDQSASTLIKRYRGFCGLPTAYEQFAEAEAFKQYSWEWLSQAPYKISSKWDKSQDQTKGEVSFYSKKSEEPFFHCAITQTGTFESQASCLKPEKKSIPIFART